MDFQSWSLYEKDKAIANRAVLIPLAKHLHNKLSVDLSLSSIKLNFQNFMYTISNSILKKTE